MNTHVVFLALDALGKATELYLRLREAAKQSGELTPEQEQQLDARHAELMAQPHWKVD